MNHIVTHDDSDEPQSEPRSEARSEPRKKAKKTRVLHTRVPAVLEQELKRLASSWRMPVSNVVRAILEDALEAVDAVGEKAEGELQGIAERLGRQRSELRNRVDVRATEPPGEPTEPIEEPEEPEEPVEPVEPEAAAEPAEQVPQCPSEPPEALEGVLGYQPLVLASEQRCAGCGRTLSAGTSVSRGVFDDPSRRVFLGPGCRLIPGGDNREG